MSATVKAMCDALVDERLADLASDRWAVAFAAYLAGLESRPLDPAMRAYVERSKRLLAGREITDGH